MHTGRGNCKERAVLYRERRWTIEKESYGRVASEWRVWSVSWEQIGVLRLRVTEWLALMNNIKIYEIVNEDFNTRCVLETPDSLTPKCVPLPSLKHPYPEIKNSSSSGSRGRCSR
jgi:hypothetical protein